jgi:hypothetical protein
MFKSSPLPNQQSVPNNPQQPGIQSVPGIMPNAAAQVNREQIYKWILDLGNPDNRETALLELSKKRELVPDLAPMLWYSFGTIAALLQVMRAFSFFSRMFLILK